MLTPSLPHNFTELPSYRATELSTPGMGACRLMMSSRSTAALVRRTELLACLMATRREIASPDDIGLATAGLFQHLATNI